VPIAVITFDFEPFVSVGDGVVRWETLGVAVALFAALGLAGIGARTMELRADDMIFIVLGIVPGAVVGGRLGYVLLHPAFFGARPGTILDPSVGSLELGLAVVGGALTGGIVAALLGGAVGRWFHISALPVLMALGAGKLALVLGGRGQGQPWDGAWATAFAGPGPWGSLGADIPSHPSQTYEGFATLIVLLAMMAILALPGLRRPDGRAFLIALGLWALVRALVAMTWRDPIVFGPLRAEQVLDLAIVAGCVAGFAILLRRERPPSSVSTTG
jgi:phosphatidylglycerol:prolipoprotein diacylglycerol transferase